MRKTGQTIQGISTSNYCNHGPNQAQKEAHTMNKVSLVAGHTRMRWATYCLNPAHLVIQARNQLTEIEVGLSMVLKGPFLVHIKFLEFS